MSRGLRIVVALGATMAALLSGVIYPWLARREAWETVTWQNGWALFALPIVPLVWWWGTFGQDQRTPRLRIGNIAALVKGPRGVRAHMRDFPGSVRAAALVLLILAMARPVSVLRDTKSDDKGIDIMLVMDLSGSMRAVLDADPKDLPGRPQLARGRRLTRLDTAKIVIKDFIDRRRTDRIGVVVFGKEAFILSPPTLDYQLLTQLVSKMGLDVIDGTATAIGDAIGTAAARLRRSDAKSKVIILLTDGDSNAGTLAPESAIPLATSVGAKVYTIQIGNDDEVDVEEGVDLLGQPIYRRARFPVNPALLKKIAKDTGGEAFIATDGKALADSMHSVLDHLERTRFEARVASFEDLFPFLLVPGALLVALDALLRALLLRRFP
ncbi:aerotolerance protein [Minicystis rosea]|nr:aerotolerance protein [Minicystis rosea]